MGVFESSCGDGRSRYKVNDFDWHFLLFVIFFSMFDTLIKNGTVIDGSGKPMFRADIGVKEEAIVAIGDLRNEGGERVIDAEGKYVVPGFIDVNNHSDVYWQIFREPNLESMVRQGITTLIGGNAGSSLAPLVSKDAIRSIQKWTDVEKITFNWLSMKDFLAEVEKKKLSTNFATLVGHGTIRRGVLHDVMRMVKEDDISVMEHLLKRSMKEGAIGLSTGLCYTHAKSATPSEILDLAEVSGKYEGLYVTYLRNESEDLLSSIVEAITTAKEAKAPLHISHLKAVGRKHWNLFEEALSMIEAADLDGLRISFDIYPYTTTGSVLYTFLPEWVTEGGRKIMLNHLKNTLTRNNVVREMRKSGIDYASMSVLSSSLSKMLSRRRILDIAQSQEKYPEDVIIDLLLASDGRAIVSIESLSEHNIRHGLQHPFAIVSSNGSGYSLQSQSSGEMVHPRSFGTFPRVLGRYVRDEKILSWEEAIRKMTGFPAERFHIKNRGFLREGYAADVVVLDPSRIADTATEESPYQYPIGVDWVLVNGVPTITEGVFSGARSGKVIRKESKLFSW